MSRKYILKNYKPTKHNSYRHGLSLFQHYCIDCNRKIDWRAIRCKSCATKGIRLAITYKDFWEADNGKTLCKKCHNKTKGIINEKH